MKYSPLYRNPLSESSSVVTLSMAQGVSLRDGDSVGEVTAGVGGRVESQVRNSCTSPERSSPSSFE